MANDQHAVICPQGNLRSRKLYDPSGYTVMSPSGFKTFADLDTAVLWGMKKGYNLRMSLPLKPGGLQGQRVSDFAIAQHRAEAALAAPVEQEE